MTNNELAKERLGKYEKVIEYIRGHVPPVTLEAFKQGYSESFNGMEPSIEYLLGQFDSQTFLVATLAILIEGYHKLNITTTNPILNGIEETVALQYVSIADMIKEIVEAENKEIDLMRQRLKNQFPDL